MRRARILSLVAVLLGASIADGKPNETLKLTAPDRIADNFISGSTLHLNSTAPTLLLECLTL